MKSSFLDRHNVETEAIQYARTRLKMTGIHFPLFDAKLSQEENYAAFRLYAEQENKFIREYYESLQPAKPSLPDTPTKKTWQPWGDD